MTTSTYDPFSSRLTRQHAVRDPSGTPVSSVATEGSYDAGGQRVLFNNQLRSARVETNATGEVISYEEFHPYGTTAYHAGLGVLDANPQRYRYSGKERDAESWLYYYGARYLAPWLGRWVSPDPAGFVDGVNVYVFVRGRPSTGWDEEGRDDIEYEHGDQTHRTLQFNPYSDNELEEASGYGWEHENGEREMLSVGQAIDAGFIALPSITFTTQSEMDNFLDELDLDLVRPNTQESIVDLVEAGGEAQAAVLEVMLTVAGSGNELALDSGIEAVQNAGGTAFTSLARATGRVVGSVPRGSTTQLRNRLIAASGGALRQADASSIAPHLLIPISVLESSEVGQCAVRSGIFDANGLNNSEALRNSATQVAGISSNLPQHLHGSTHRQYTRLVSARVEDIERRFLGATTDAERDSIARELQGVADWARQNLSDPDVIPRGTAGQLATNSANPRNLWLYSA